MTGASVGRFSSWWAILSSGSQCLYARVAIADEKSPAFKSAAMHSGKDQAGFELVTVQTGVRSLRSREFGETFHPVVGPMIEAVALHVRQQRLVERAALTSGSFVIWDVGLGAAANAIAVLEAFQTAQPPARVELHSFDHTTAPLAFAFEHALELGYLAPPHGGAAAPLLRMRPVAEPAAAGFRLALSYG